LASERKHATAFFENALVPKHDVLTESETRKVLEELHTTVDKLPRIFVKDPALKGKAKVGDVVRTIREDVPGKKYDYYRVVVEGQRGA
jgi:DNA-directed RNA polymerase subunit H